MIKKDDRNEKQLISHIWGVVARDNHMSGWGGASGGYSRCAWALDSYEKAEYFKRWVDSRSEMKYVNIVDLRTYRAPRGTAHFHIYVVDRDDHNGMKGYKS